MQAWLDSTGLDSGPVNNTHAMQPRRDTRRSLGAVVLWWIGTVLGPRSFGPFSLIGWRLAGVSAVNAGQGQQAGPGFSIIQLLGATATDQTRQDKTPFAVRARCKKVLSQTAREERSGAAGNGKEWWDGGLR